MEPGSPSLLRPRKPPSSAVRRVISRTLGAVRQGLIGALEGKQCLPLVLFKGNATRSQWRVAREFLNMLDSPGHHQVNGEAVLPHRAICELTVLNTANTFDRAVILFDAPTSFVPVDLFERLLEVVDLDVVNSIHSTASFCEGGSTSVT